MQLEIHILQSFPPANLNRDENGMPKSTVFGGRARARISSQCQKRAVRKYYQQYGDIDASHFAQRSRGWLPKLTGFLTEAQLPEEQSKLAAQFVLEELGIKFKKNKQNELEPDTILFLGDTEFQAIAHILTNNWNAIATGLAAKTPALPKKEPNIPKLIKQSLISTGKPGDVALFGRMMAALPSINVDAAVQMAHAIGINRLQQEFDFFTAVDDLGASDHQGADYLDETGYNSSTYYRFTNLDLKQLAINLGDAEQTIPVARAFAEAFIKAVPTGHQNGFAAHSLPALVMITVREGQPISLVDAFEVPIRPEGKHGLLDNAVISFDKHWQEIKTMYGDKSLKYHGLVTRQRLSHHLDALKKEKMPSSMDELLEEALTICAGG